MSLGAASGSGWTRVCISIGVAGFLLALTVSAVLVPQLRLLHLLYALIYLAVLALPRRNSTWGFGAGIDVHSDLKTRTYWPTFAPSGRSRRAKRDKLGENWASGQKVKEGSQ